MSSLIPASPHFYAVHDAAVCDNTCAEFLQSVHSLGSGGVHVYEAAVAKQEKQSQMLALRHGDRHFHEI